MFELVKNVRVKTFSGSNVEFLDNEVNEFLKNDKIKFIGIQTAACGDRFVKWIFYTLIYEEFE